MFQCEPCQTYWDGWRDYQEPYRGWKHQGPAKMSVDSYHQKASERRELVIRQQNMKLESCRAKGCIA
jgi:hypothetical protein